MSYYLNEGDETRLEHIFSGLSTTEFLRKIAFPRREQVKGFANYPP